MVELRLLNSIFKSAAIILFISGVIDIMLYLIRGYHAPSWVLGITWIMIGFMLMAFTGGVLNAGSQ